ncbi:RM35 protein, partial [Pseudoatta argentina]
MTFFLDFIIYLASTHIGFSVLSGIVARTSTNATNCITSRCNPVLNSIQHKEFGALLIAVQKWAAVVPTQHKTLLNHATTENRLALPAEPINVPIRTVIKFTMAKGKRQTVKTVLKRFYRLHWGIWIRTRTGRHNKLWTKSVSRKKRLRRHVFCNATQSTLLDKMVSKYWKRRHYYVDDPYEPYHDREEFRNTRRNPLP